LSGSWATVFLYQLWVMSLLVIRNTRHGSAVENTTLGRAPMLDTHCDWLIGRFVGTDRFFFQIFDHNLKLIKYETISFHYYLTFNTKQSVHTFHISDQTGINRNRLLNY
jgi:hypothetical protein